MQYLNNYLSKELRVNVEKKMLGELKQRHRRTASSFVNCSLDVKHQSINQSINRVLSL